MKTNIKTLASFILSLSCAMVLSSAVTLSTFGCPKDKHQKESNQHKAIKVSGAADFSNAHFKSLSVNGALDLNNSKVDERIKVHGAASLNKVQVGSVKVYGALHAKGVVVHGTAKIAGALVAHNSKFQDIKISTVECALENTTTKNIVFETDSHKKQQKLVLKGKTVINGDITFESENGEVILDKTSTIKGKIIGGKIIQ